MSFYAELKRRNVIRVAIAYVAISWLLIQVVETLFPVYGLSDAAIRMVVAVIAVGFVPSLVISWAFEFTPEGIVRDAKVDRDDPGTITSGKKLDRIILVVLAIGSGYLAFDKFVLDPARDVEMVEEATRQGRSDTITESYGDKSIAVLPFINMSADPDQAFFSDGIAEELLNLFANIPGLRVSPRLSSFRFRGEGWSSREVAEKLNVIYLLEGSVRKAGNQVRIAVKLIDSRTDTQLWSDTFDRSLEDIFAIQDEVAGQVVQQLRVTLLGEIPDSRPINVLAYPLFLQAQQILRLHQFDDLETAEELLTKALEYDPAYVSALMELSKVYWYQFRWFDQSEKEALIAETRLKVLALDPDNPTLKAHIAFDKWGDNEIVAAARFLEESAEIHPSDEDVLRVSATIAEYTANVDLAIHIYEYLAERIPLELWVHFGLANSYFLEGRTDEAILQYAIIRQLNPERDEAMWGSGLARLVAGDPVGAIKDFEQDTWEGYRLHGKAMALHDLGLKEESEATILALHRFIEETEPSWIMGFARLYAWIGDSDQAFHYLELMAEHIPRRLFNASYNPLYQKLYDDPRWLPLLENAGCSPAQLAEIEFNPRLPNDLL